MGQNREQKNRPEALIGRPGGQTESFDQRVHRQTGQGRNGDHLMAVCRSARPVREKELLQKEQQQVTQQNHGRDGYRVPVCNRFRQKVEKDYTEENTRPEGQKQVKQFVRPGLDKGDHAAEEGDYEDHC